MSQQLIEIKKGMTGTGLIIDTDGYISLTEDNNKKLYESIQLNENEGHDFHCPYPFVVNAVFQKFGIENANGRIYPESVLKRQVELYQQKIKEKRAIGELNHPEQTSIDLERVGMNILELHWEGHTLVGQLEVITTPGFRKYGICSSIGDQAANLLLNGIKIGVSSRGVGSVEQQFGKTIVGNDYEIICWDFVSDPSTPSAWIAPPGAPVDGAWLESVEKKGTQINEDALSNKLDKFKDWLNL